jgi:hypothetical protein
MAKAFQGMVYTQTTFGLLVNRLVMAMTLTGMSYATRFCVAMIFTGMPGGLDDDGSSDNQFWYDHDLN